jgi:hypothetical protein
MNRFFDQFVKLALGVKLGVLGVLVGMIIAVNHIFFFKPLKLSLMRRKVKAVSLQAKYVENQAIADNLPKFQEEVNLLKNHFVKPLPCCRMKPTFTLYIDSCLLKLKNPMWKCSPSNQVEQAKKDFIQ